MAIGNNTLFYFTTLGSATAPQRGLDIGSFTLDNSNGTYITIFEGAGGGEDTHLNDEIGGGGTNISSDQIVDGGPFDGAVATTISRFQVTDDTGQVVGKVYELCVDQDGNGKAHQTPEIIGYVLVGDYTAGDTYTVENSYAAHESDVGGMTYADVFLPAPCFTSGTLIETKMGDRLIQDLRDGDLVLTLDNGYQPIRWIGSTTRAAIGVNAPILIRRGTLNNKRDLLVSPQHRMLIQGWQAQLLFGESQVLVPAKSLLNDHSIRRVLGGEVEYYHILFDSHQVIYAEGCPSESFHPCAQGFNALDSETRREVAELFPELATGDFAAYGPPSRVCLKHFEGKVLSGSFA